MAVAQLPACGKGFKGLKASQAVETDRVTYLTRRDLFVRGRKQRLHPRPEAIVLLLC
jgi:hypothetical protein